MQKNNAQQLDLESMRAQKSSMEQQFNESSINQAIILNQLGLTTSRLANTQSRLPDLENQLSRLEIEYLGKRGDYAASEEARVAQESSMEQLKQELQMYKELYSSTRNTLKKVIATTSPSNLLNKELESPSFSGQISDSFDNKILEFDLSNLKFSQQDSEMILAKSVLENDLSELNSLIENEKKLKEKLDNLQKKHASESDSSSIEIASLQEQITTLKDKLFHLQEKPEILEDLETSSLTPKQVQLLSKKAISLKNENDQLRLKLQQVAEQWSGDLASRAEHYTAFYKLKTQLQKLRREYAELDQKTSQTINIKIKEEVKSRDSIIKAQALQIQTLLYELHKLRRYVSKKFSLHIPALDRSNPLKLSSVQDVECYQSIEELVLQNKRLKQMLYVAESKASQKGTPGTEGGRLSVKVEKMKEKNRELLSEVRSWKESTKKVISDKNEAMQRVNASKEAVLAEKENLSAQVMMLQESKQEMLATIQSLTSQDSNKDVDLLQAKSEISGLESGVLTLKKQIKELKTALKQKIIDEKSKVWETVTISVEPLPPQNALQVYENLIQKIGDLLSQNLDYLKQNLEWTKESKTSLVEVQKYKSEIELLQKVIECQKDLGSKEKSQFLDLLEHSRNFKTQSDTQDLDSFLSSMSFVSDLSSISPTAMLLRQSKIINELRQKICTLAKDEELEKEGMEAEGGQQSPQMVPPVQQVESLHKRISQLEELLAKANLEKQTILEALQQDGDNQEVFDAIKFKTLLSSSKDLQAQVDSLTEQLATEKSLNHSLALQTEDLSKKVHLLGEELNNVCQVRNLLLSQASSQKTAFEVQLETEKQRATFLKTENDIATIKMQKMVQGIKLLKSHMYDSLNEIQRQENLAALQDIDTALIGLGRSMEQAKSEQASKSSKFQEESRSTLASILEQLGKNTTSIQMLASREDKVMMEEVENLKNQLVQLQTVNSQQQKTLERSQKQQKLQQKQQQQQHLEQGREAKIDPALQTGVDMERMTNVLEKSINLIQRIRNTPSAQTNPVIGEEQATPLMEVRKFEGF